VLSGLGRILLLVGGGLFLFGLLLVFLDKFPWAGRLPGDIVWKRDNLVVYAPLGAMILASLVLTVVLNLIVRLRR
jgi:hypothetical protein